MLVVRTKMYLDDWISSDSKALPVFKKQKYKVDLFLDGYDELDDLTAGLNAKLVPFFRLIEFKTSMDKIEKKKWEIHVRPEVVFQFEDWKRENGLSIYSTQISAATPMFSRFVNGCVFYGSIEMTDKSDISILKSSLELNKNPVFGILGVKNG